MAAKETVTTHIDKKVILGVPIYIEKKDKVQPHLSDLRGKMFFS